MALFIGKLKEVERLYEKKMYRAFQITLGDLLWWMGNHEDECTKQELDMAHDLSKKFLRLMRFRSQGDMI